MAGTSSRRQFSQGLTALIASTIVMKCAWESNAYAAPVKPEIDRWIRRLFEMCRDVKTNALKPTEWQVQIAELHAKVGLAEILRFVDIDKLLQGVSYPKDVGAVVDVPFPAIDGLPEHLGFGHKVFAYRKGAATPPHAHNNLASAHLVLRGTLRARTYHRVRDEQRHIVMDPSIDKSVVPGDTVTMSDDRDNVHWFVAEHDGACTLDIPVGGFLHERRYGLAANQYQMIFVDPTSGKTEDGRLIRAAVLDFQSAVAKFGGK